MAELLLKVDRGSGYDDGDVLCAFNRRRIRCVHAQHICHPWEQRPNPDLYLDRGTHVEDWFAETHQYRMDRVSKWTATRTDLATGETKEIRCATWRIGIAAEEAEIAADDRMTELRAWLRARNVLDVDQRKPLWHYAPDSGLAAMLAAQQFGYLRDDMSLLLRNVGEPALVIQGLVIPYSIQLLNPHYSDLPVFFLRRRRHLARHGGTKLPIFNTFGQEVLYRGRVDTSHGKLDRVWQRIETKTPQRESSHTRWPMGRLDLMHHLAITTDEFDDEQADAMVRPEFEEESTELEQLAGRRMIRKRNASVPLERLSSLSPADRRRVRDKSHSFDHREARSYSLASIIHDKRGG